MVLTKKNNNSLSEWYTNIECYKNNRINNIDSVKKQQKQRLKNCCELCSQMFLAHSILVNVLVPLHAALNLCLCPLRSQTKKVVMVITM